MPLYARVESAAATTGAFLARCLAVAIFLRDCCRLAGLVFREILHAVVKYAMAAYATRGQSKTTVQCVQWHMCINVETRLTYTLPRQIGRDYDK